MLTSPILDINISTEKEMGKILVFKCRYQMIKKSAGVTLYVNKTALLNFEGFQVNN